MKRILIISMLILTGFLFANAQDKTDANKLIQDRISNMKSNLSLNSTESKTFWSAYEQYLRAEVKYHETYRSNLEKKGIKPCCPNCDNTCTSLKDDQITYLYDQKFELKKNLYTLESNFYKKAKSILTPKHLQEFYKIDERYKRSFVKNKKPASNATQTKSQTATPNKAKR